MNKLSLTLSRAPGVFWMPDSAFIAELAETLRGLRVLEVFAGNGLLAAHLAAQGVQVTATSEFSGMDAHEHGLYYPVVEASAVSAVMEHGAEHDVLLMSWPTVTEDAYYAARFFDKPVIIIGEYTDYAKNILGGCATDRFWAHAQITRRFKSYPARPGEAALMVEMLNTPREEFKLAMRCWEKARGH